MRGGVWCGSVLISLQLCAAAARATPPAPSTILIDAASGQSLREEDADAAYPPGTLSQLMVLLISLEESGLGLFALDAPVTVSELAAGGGPRQWRQAAAENAIPLRRDKAYLLSDLLKAIAVGSAGDAAVAVAEAVAGSVPSCLELMNARARKLGMMATHYATLGGLPPSPPGAPDTTTARDLARLARALLRYPQVLQWSSLSGLPFDGGSTLLHNVDRLIGTVPGVDGLQVASSRRTGYAIVATARRGTLRLIAVVLGAPDGPSRYRTGADLLEWGFTHYERVEVVRRDEPLNLPIRVLGGVQAYITPVAGRTFSLLRPRGREEDLQIHYQLPTALRAPLRRGQPIGEVIVEERGRMLAVVPVVSPAAVAAKSILSAARQ
jgi:serine-type D-Ala-D-Ala carboxypeptidase (penicillin-binding protein 5/6)